MAGLTLGGGYGPLIGRFGLALDRLPLALRHHPDLGNIGRLTLAQSLLCVRLVLWDETAHRLISFRELRTLPGANTSA
jgi:fatty acid desaturase